MFADSHDSQGSAPAVPHEFRGFARFARDADPGARLAQFANEHAIDWPAAQRQMIKGDIEAAVEQLNADAGDGAELACVRLWLELLAARGSLS